MRVCINPEIMELSDELDVFPEGCLSAQGRFRALVLRPKTVTVRYQDLKGDHHQIQLAGNDARVMLHELDHILNGKVYIQRIIDELSVSQCQILSDIIRTVLSRQDEAANGNPFLTPIILFDRTGDGVVRFDEGKVQSIFQDTKKNVLVGLLGVLEKKILSNSSTLGNGAKR
jgi:hypothetical protein